MKVFFAELRRALSSPGFPIAVAGTIIVALVGGWQNFDTLRQIDGSMNIGELFLQATYGAIHSDALILVMPILCTLPYSASFMEDFQSRYLRAYLPRTGRRTYLVSKIAATAISGGASIFAGTVVVLLICIALFPPMGLLKDDSIFTWSVFTLTAFLVSFGALIWSLAGGIAAVALKNRFMAYAVPFIIFYLLTSFQARYFRTAYALSPLEWIKPANLDFLIALACSFIAFAGACIIYYMVMKQRLRDV